MNDRHRKLLIRDGHLCFYCGKQLARAGSGHRHAITVEHLISRSKGGSNSLTNLRLAGAACNERVGDRFFCEKLKMRDTWFSSDHEDYSKFFARNGYWTYLENGKFGWVEDLDDLPAEDLFSEVVSPAEYLNPEEAPEKPPRWHVSTIWERKVGDDWEVKVRQTDQFRGILTIQCGITKEVYLQTPVTIRQRAGKGVTMGEEHEWLSIAREYLEA